MSLIGQKALDGRRADFITASAAAAEVGVSASTVKKWLKERRVPGVEWGRDRNGWILVSKESLPLLRKHFDGVKLSKS